MTKSKIIRLINELIKKHGDVEVGRTYDYYKSRLIQENGEYVDDNDCIIDSFKLSQISDYITCRSEYERIADIVNGRSSIPMCPVEVDESKELFNSETQKLRRKHHLREFESFINCGFPLGGGYNFKLLNFYKDFIIPATEPKLTPKQFGMRVNNRSWVKNKNH